MSKTVADSTFYLLFYHDIEEPTMLHHIMETYDFCIGPIIKEEISRHIDSDQRFGELVTDYALEVDFVNWKGPTHRRP